MLSLSVCILRSLCVYYDLCVYTTISVVFLSHHYLKRTKAGKNKGIIRQTIKDEERWSRKQNRRQGKQKTVWTNTRIEIFSKFFELKFKSQTFLSQEQIFFGLFLRPTNLPTSATTLIGRIFSPWPWTANWKCGTISEVDVTNIWT